MIRKSYTFWNFLSSFFSIPWLLALSRVHGHVLNQTLRTYKEGAADFPADYRSPACITAGDSFSGPTGLSAVEALSGPVCRELQITCVKWSSFGLRQWFTDHACGELASLVCSVLVKDGMPTLALPEESCTGTLQRLYTVIFSFVQLLWLAFFFAFWMTIWWELEFYVMFGFL